MCSVIAEILCEKLDIRFNLSIKKVYYWTMDLQNMSQAETEESSQSILYNPDFLAIIG